MQQRTFDKLDAQLSEFLDYMTDGLGRPERRQALSLYLMASIHKTRRLCRNEEVNKNHRLEQQATTVQEAGGRERIGSRDC